MYVCNLRVSPEPPSHLVSDHLRLNSLYLLYHCDQIPVHPGRAAVFPPKLTFKVVYSRYCEIPLIKPQNQAEPTLVLTVGTVIIRGQEGVHLGGGDALGAGCPACPHVSTCQATPGRLHAFPPGTLLRCTLVSGGRSACQQGATRGHSDCGETVSEGRFRRGRNSGCSPAPEGSG